MTRIALPLGILSIGCVAYVLLSVAPEEEKSPPTEETAIRTRVAELHIQDYSVVIQANGIVRPHNEIALHTEVSGQITKIHPAFEVGSYFSKGDVLVELDESDHRNALAIAEARFLSAWSALGLATVRLERTKALYRKSYASKATVQQATASQEQASAQLDVAIAQREQAKRDLERTKIVAPFDGRVRDKDVGLGQSVGPGTSLGIVFAVDFAEVRLPIAARELPRLDLPELPEDPAVDVVFRDAINEESETVWKGKVIRTEGALDRNSLELFAIARVEDPFGRKSGQPALRIGQPVVGAITGETLEDVVALPRAAVRQLDQVFLVDEENLTLRAATVTPIWSDEEHIVVRDPAIGDGTWLATTRIVYAPEGAKVEIIPDVDSTRTPATSPTMKKTK